MTILARGDCILILWLGRGGLKSSRRRIFGVASMDAAITAHRKDEVHIIKPYKGLFTSPNKIIIAKRVEATSGVE